MKKLVLGYVVIFGIIGIIVFFASGQDPDALMGVGLAALIGFVIMAFQMRSQWSGTIEDFVEKNVEVGGSDESSHYETRLYAVVRMDSGKKKNVQADPRWKVGDRLVKKRGQTDIQVNPQT